LVVGRNVESNVVDSANSRKTEFIGRGQLDLRLKPGGRITGKEKIKNVGLVVDIGNIDMVITVEVGSKISHQLFSTHIPGKRKAARVMDKISIKIKNKIKGKENNKD
jgi:hypothetical protein